MNPLFTITLILIGLFFWLLTRKTGMDAPYIPLEPHVVQNIINISKIGKDDIFYDLGSGDGRLVIAAAMMGAKSHGVETDLARVLYSNLLINILRLSKLASVIRGDLFDTNLKKATIVHVYLLQHTNDKLEKKLKKELKKGTKVISSAFEFKSLKLISTHNNGPIYGPIRLYKI